MWAYWDTESPSPSCPSTGFCSSAQDRSNTHSTPVWPIISRPDTLNATEAYQIPFLFGTISIRVLSKYPLQMSAASVSFSQPQLRNTCEQPPAPDQVWAPPITDLLQVPLEEGLGQKETTGHTHQSCFQSQLSYSCTLLWLLWIFYLLLNFRKQSLQFFNLLLILRGPSVCLLYSLSQYCWGETVIRAKHLETK